MRRRVSGGRFELVADRTVEEVKKQELYTEVGRAVVHLSNIENCLADIFYRLAGVKITHQFAIGLFYSQTFDNKVALVELLMRLEGPQEQLGNWEKLTAELRTHRGVRNLIAHQGLHVGFPDKQGVVDVALLPAPLRTKYDPKKKSIVPSKGIRLGIAEIRSTASALDHLQSELQRLWTAIDNHFLPKELRSDYLWPDDD